MAQPKALIVGAGVGGLSTALSLSRIGWQVNLVEKAENLRADGYMIGLSGPGYTAAQRLNILPELLQHDRQIKENLYLDKNGKEILRVRYHELLKSLKWLTLARTDLVAELYGKVKLEPNCNLMFATQLLSFEQEEQKVRAQLSNGETAEVDLLIGADGLHSKTRSSLFEEQSPLEYMGYRVAAFQLENSLGLKNDFLSYAMPGRLAEFYTLKNNRTASLYIWKDQQMGRPRDREEAKKILLQQYSDSHPDTCHWINVLTNDEPLFFDALAMVDLPSWSKGRVMLLGDAAHCLTLLSGQGAGMAMTSACLLAELLQKSSVEQALKQHEAALRPAILRLQQRSRDIAPWFIPATKGSFQWRNLLLKWLPKSLIGWYFLRAVRSDILAASQGGTEP